MSFSIFEWQIFFLFSLPRQYYGFQRIILSIYIDKKYTMKTWWKVSLKYLWVLKTRSSIVLTLPICVPEAYFLTWRENSLPIHHVTITAVFKFWPTMITVLTSLHVHWQCMIYNGCLNVCTEVYRGRPIMSGKSLLSHLRRQFLSVTWLPTLSSSSDIMSPAFLGPSTIVWPPLFHCQYN